MAESELTVRITARDDATPAVEDAAKRMESAGARVRGASTSLVAQTREATVTVRAMSIGLLQELNPALALASSQFTAATREARHLPPVLGAITLAMAAAAIGAGQFVGVLREAATVQAQLNLAVRASDFSGATGQLRALTQQLETFSLFVPKAIQGLLDMTRTPGALNILDRLLGRPDPALIQSAIAAVRMIAPAEMERQIAEARVGMVAATRELAQLEAQRAKGSVDLEEFGRQQSKVTSLINEETTAHKALLRARADVAAKALRAAGVPEDVIQQTVFARMAEDLQTLKLRADAAFSKHGLENFRSLLELAQTVNTSIKSISDPELEEALQKGLSAVREIRQESTAAAAERAGIVSSMREAELERLKIGADAAMRAQLSLEQVAARTGLGKAAVPEGVNADFKRAQIEAQGRLEAAQIEFAEKLRIKPAAGFDEGLRQMEEQWSSTGQVMTEVARETAMSMQQALSDNLFTVVTGQFDDLAEAGKRMSLSIVRSLTDAVSQMLTAGTIRTLRSAFAPEGTRMLESVAAPLALVGGGGAGGLMVFAPGAAQAGALAAGGGLPAGAAATGTLAGGAAGAGGTSILSVLASAGSAALTAGGNLASSVAELFGLGAGAGAVGTGALSPAATTSVAGGFAAGSSGVGLSSVGSFATAATGIGAAAGLGLTVYTALQGPPTAENIALSAVSGAISGAVLGVTLAALGVATAGVGLVVGLIAGALIGGGAAAAGKGGGDKRAKRRAESAAAGRTVIGELQRAVQAAEADGRAALDALRPLNNAPTGRRALDAFRASLLRARVAGGQASAYGVLKRAARYNIGGHFAANLRNLPGHAVTVPKPRLREFIGEAGPEEDFSVGDALGILGLASIEPDALSRLLDDIATIRERLIADEAEAARRFALELFQAERAVPVGFEEPFGEPFEPAGGVVVRRTIVPATERGTFAGRDLFTFSAALIRDRFDPDIAEMLLRRLVEVDRDRALGILSREVI